MSDPFAALPAEATARLVPAPQPTWMPPMLATLTERRFSDPNWIFERKLDGVRCLAFRSGSDLRLMTRNRLDASGRYGEVAEALAGQPAEDFLVDGEVVAFAGHHTSFQLLQRRMIAGARVRIFFYVFDVLHAGGFDTTRLQLRHRKAVLRRLLSYEGPLRFTTHRNAEGEAYWREACGKGWEGVIGKRSDSEYVSRRSPDWLKFKCVNEQEFVIVGFTEPKGSRTGLGAILIGYYEGDDLRYAGKVGTGFDHALLEDLSARLAAVEREGPPFAAEHLPRKGVHWVEPRLVAQVGFSEWTRDGHLRHPRFQGLREDKPARQVVRERPRA